MAIDHICGRELWKICHPGNIRHLYSLHDGNVIEVVNTKHIDKPLWGGWLGITKRCQRKDSNDFVVVVDSSTRFTYPLDSPSLSVCTLDYHRKQQTNHRHEYQHSAKAEPGNRLMRVVSLEVVIERAPCFSDGRVVACRSLLTQPCYPVHCQPIGLRSIPLSG